MVKYYSNKPDFTQSQLFLQGISYKTQVKNILEDITIATKVVQEEALESLYVAIGNATLGKDMPEEPLSKAHDRTYTILEAATKVHDEVMQRVDGKFTKGVDNSLISLNQVNSSENPYTSSTLTYKVEEDAQAYGAQAQHGPPIEYDKHYTLNQLLDPRTSPIPAAQTVYQRHLDSLKKRLSELEGLTQEQINQYQAMSDEELMTHFYALGGSGGYEGLKATSWHEDNKEWLVPLEQVLGMTILAVSIVAAVVSAGATTPGIVAGAGMVAAAGGGYTAISGGYSAVTGNTMIAGNPLDTDDRIWAGVEAATAVGALGLGKAVAMAGASDDTVAAATNTSQVTDDAASLAHTGYDTVVHGEDPTLGLVSFAGNRALDNIRAGATNPQPVSNDRPNQQTDIGLSSDSHVHIAQDSGGLWVPGADPVHGNKDELWLPGADQQSGNSSDFWVPGVDPVHGNKDELWLPGADQRPRNPNDLWVPSGTGISQRGDTVLPVADMVSTGPDVPVVGMVGLSGGTMIDSRPTGPDTPISERPSEVDSPHPTHLASNHTFSPEWEKVNSDFPAHGLTENQKAMITDIPHGQRPDPTTYLSADYIEKHKALFDSGFVAFARDRQNLDRFQQFGRDDGAFVLPKYIAEAMIKESDGDPRVLEVLLGLDSGSLGDKPVLFEMDAVENFRLPNGNEAGSNEYWRPGGQTYPGGIPEGVIDPVPVDDVKVTEIW